MSAFSRSLLASLFLLPLYSFSQNWQPLWRGETYEYALPNGGVYVLRVDSVAASGADSVFYLPHIISSFDSSGTATTCPSLFGTQRMFQMGHDNAIGRSMVKKPNGEFLFLGDSPGDSFLIKTQVSPGDSWTFCAALNQTATVLSKSSITLPGLGVTDSVMTLQVNFIGNIVLSRSHGLIEFTNFVNYWDYLVPAVEADFTLRSIRERGLGPTLPSFDSVFDFDPGDQFDFENWRDFSYHMYSSYTILSRNNTGDPDVISYEAVSQNLTINFMPYSWNYFPPDTVTLIYHRSSYSILDKPTYYVEVEPTFNVSPLHISTPGPLLWPGREQITINRTYLYDSCFHTLNVPLDNWRYDVYADKIGFVKMEAGTLTDDEHMLLVCYRKAQGPDAGTCIDWVTLLANEEPVAPQAEFNLFPNPAAESVALRLNNLQNASAVIRIFTLTGVEAHPAAAIRPGASQCEINLSELPAGIYLVQVEAEGFAPGVQKLVVE